MLALATNSIDHCFMVLATGITIVNIDRKTFIVQATAVGFKKHFFTVTYDYTK
jgi:hypothetical protein